VFLIAWGRFEGRGHFAAHHILLQLYPLVNSLLDSLIDRISRRWAHGGVVRIFSSRRLKGGGNAIEAIAIPTAQ
jgi:hypothetical protein